MSSDGTVKIDIGLGGLFDFCLPGYDEGGSLSGNEVHTYKADGDDGASEVFDPVADFVRKASLDRFDAPTSTETTFAMRGKTRVEKTLYPLTHVAVCAEIDNQSGAVLRVYEEKTGQRDCASGPPAVEPQFAKLVAVDEGENDPARL